MSGLRIVHCFRAPVGGVFRHVRDLCAAQSAAGHEVGIVCDSSTGGALEDAQFAEISRTASLGVERTPMQRQVGAGDIASAWRTYRIIRRMLPDVLHGHGAKGGLYARLFGTALKMSGRPIARIYSPHGGSLHYDPAALSGRVYFSAERLLGRLTDHFIFVAACEEQVYARKVGNPRAPFKVVHNGLRQEEFIPVHDAPGAADFVFIGAMRDLKGPDLLIEAMAQAERRTGRALSAVMVGDGQEIGRYRARARALGLGERVFFLPAMTARDAFGLGRIMVVPSRAEAMPYIVIEALAAGRPLIATSVGGIPEILGHNSPALCEPDAGSLAEKMVEALRDEQAFRSYMPDRETLRARFGIEAMAAGVEAIYFKALRLADSSTAR